MRGDVLVIQEWHRKAGLKAAQLIIPQIEQGTGKYTITVAGESGSGKSELAARLVGHWQNSQSFASWVADDRVYLSAHGKHIVARVPQPTAGLAECRFSGIVPVKHLPTAIVDLAVCLHPTRELDRLPGPDWISLDESAASVPLTTFRSLS